MRVEEVAKAIGVLEGEAFSRAKRLPIVNQAIVIVESPEYCGIDQPDRTKPSTTDVNVGDTTPRYADVHNLNSE